MSAALTVPPVRSRSARFEVAASFSIVALATLALYWGWRLHWFLTDDAYIAFRFVSNRRLGFGYTWNRPPFAAVEGYSSFLWLVVLDAVWSLLGVSPPSAANNISLIAAMLSLVLSAWAVLRVCVLNARRGALPLVLGCVLLSVVSNRSFLVWASSGLETALFNLLLQAWVLLLFVARADSCKRRLHCAYALCALAAALCLTRPDGLLFAAATVSILAIWVTTGALPRRRIALCLLLLSPAAAHEVFRYATYGELLPNTYYAKVVGAWPAAGLRYAASFVLEYAYYLALPFALWALARSALRSYRVAFHQPRAGALVGLRRRSFLLTRCVGFATLCAKLGFDLGIAGGDHFEYRTLSCWVPLIAIAVAHGCLSLRLRAWSTTTLALGLIALSAVLPWTYFVQTRDHFEWPPRPSVTAIAPDVPLFLRPVARAFDDLQAWLVPRGIGVRQHEHRAFWLRLLAEYPSRAEGTRACSDAARPIAAIPNVGVGGWVLATCDIIDLRGLTDYVIARVPPPTGHEQSYLAHERRPPKGYVERFRPNVVVNDKQVFIRRRAVPLSDDDIRAAELFGRRSLSLAHPVTAR